MWLARTVAIGALLGLRSALLVLGTTSTWALISAVIFACKKIRKIFVPRQICFADGKTDAFDFRTTESSIEDAGSEGCALVSGQSNARITSASGSCVPTPLTRTTLIPLTTVEVDLTVDELRTLADVCRLPADYPG